ncbi:MAG: TrmH family RNA methyltransferase [Anaerolineae bacterium]
MRYKKYTRDAPHAYTFGVFPTLELLAHQPGRVVEVLLHSSGVRNAGVAKIRALCEAATIPLTHDDKLIERLEAREDTYAIGVFRKYETALDPAVNHLVLVNPSDMGNLGTILRTLLGFGRRDLALIKPAADIFDPRAVRASMGALFQVNTTYYDSFETYRNQFPQHHLHPFMTDGACSLPDAVFTSPYALIFGSESSGLPANFHNVGTTISIPQSAAVDSLNLAVAVAVSVYEAERGRVSH